MYKAFDILGLVIWQTERVVLSIVLIKGRFKDQLALAFRQLHLKRQIIWPTDQHVNIVDVVDSKVYKMNVYINKQDGIIV